MLCDLKLLLLYGPNLNILDQSKSICSENQNYRDNTHFNTSRLQIEVDGNCKISPLKIIVVNNIQYLDNDLKC